MKKSPRLEARRVELYKVNSKLQKVLTGLVNKNIAKEARKDALYILNNCQRDTVMEFLFFALSEKGNLMCLCLDFAKDKEGKPIITKSFNKETYD